MADYEDLLYDNHPFALTHPDHLHTIAALFGLDPAPVQRCRVLELGCGLGGNLMPLAALFPESEFVGVDRSQAQIAVARADAAALGLGNIRLHAMDILDVTPAWGKFDYIICHGVFSWVPAEVQERILGICRVHLAPHGIAYISYNTWPGWHVRGMIRSMLRRHVTAIDPAERVRQARALLSTIVEYAPADRSLSARWLRKEVEVIGQLSDAYVLYEHLVDVNSPMWFSEFAEQAARSGLQYVGDAEFDSMFADKLGPGASDRLATMAQGLVETEQYLDYLNVRFFRRSLLCHCEVKLDRALTAARLFGRQVASRLRLRDDDTFESPEGMVIDTQDELVKAALKVLTEYPQGIKFETLCHYAALVVGRPPQKEDRVELGGPLLELFATGALRIGTWARPWVPIPPDRPVAPFFARHQARQGPGCTNLLHQGLGLDAVDRALIARLDGRDRAALVAAMQADLAQGLYEVTVDDAPLTDPEMIGELVDKKLAKLAQRALILAPDARESARLGAGPAGEGAT
ncbi:MAG: methyltransferase regulatory domain-containing protein [Myxococcales bacterium]|nr:methyltransferase regulatory domain-containing protein [Myxococcales bacterium]MCB9552793.1 methyltransferase regulatory domain-containing protein [Myxococcales bacterium]